MHWFARRIHRYETRRWKTDDNRLVRPFAWGLEHIGGPADHPDPAAFLRDYSRQAIENSRDWYNVTPADDYRLDSENVLTFTSSIVSPYPENNTVHAQFFPAKRHTATDSSGRGFGRAVRGGKVGALAPEARNRSAVLILPNWNAKWHGQRGLGVWLQRIGMSALKMSLPYHDRRMAHGHERADQLVGPNI